MDNQVYIADGFRTRVETYTEPLDIIAFIKKFYVILQDGIRDPLSIEILTKDSSSIFKIKLLATLPREDMPIIQPGSALLVGRRTKEERSIAKAWVEQNQTLSNASAGIKLPSKEIGNQAVNTSSLAIPPPVDKVQDQNGIQLSYKIIIICFSCLIIFLFVMRFKHRRLSNQK